MTCGQQPVLTSVWWSKRLACLCGAARRRPPEGDRGRPRRGLLEATLPQEAAGAEDSPPLPGRQGEGDILPVTNRLIVCQLT